MSAQLSAVRSPSPWLIVLGCFIALSVTYGPAVFYTFGFFVQPLTAEYGWSRSTISAGLSAASFVSAFAAPLAGKLFDRYGVRRVMLVAVPLFGASIATVSLCDVPAAYIAMYGVIGVLGAAVAPIPFAKIITSSFETQRQGLGLGVAMAGLGVGTMLMPLLTQTLISGHGWRVAYVGIGLTVVLVIVAAFLGLIRGPSIDSALVNWPDRSSLPGVELREALRSRVFWYIAISLFIVTTIVMGTVAHAVPMLASQGMSPRDAAGMMGALGVASLAGRLSCGYIFDKLFAPYVVSGVFVIIVLGVILLASGATGLAPLLAIICIGFGVGAEIDIIAYLSARYFGLRRYAEISGYFYAIFGLSAGVGAFIAGKVFDTFQSYEWALKGFAVAPLLAIALILQIGPYAFGGQQAGRSKP